MSYSRMLLIMLLLASSQQAISLPAPIVGLTGGLAVTSDLGKSTDFTYGFTEYHYHANSPTEARGILGGLIGLEFELKNDLALQSDLAYYRSAPFTAEGVLTQGVSLDNSTPFNYHYDIISQQLLLENKLLFRVKEHYRPYLLVGLGAAFNRQEDYSINYPADLLFTPFYHDNTQSSFSYTLGAGIDCSVSKKLRLGLSYRFADLGKTALGQKTIDPINPIPISGTLEQSHLYAQEIFFQLIYGTGL